MRLVATVIGSALLAVACAAVPTVVDTACTAFGPLTYSASGDTEDTKRQIRGHNAAWVRLCGAPK